MEECGKIGITGIQVIPETARAGCVREIAGDECGLSRSRGASDPDQWVVLTAFCNEREETLTTRHFMEAWSGQLRER